MKNSILASLFAVATGASMNAAALPAIYTGSSVVGGVTLSSQASFDIVGNTLTIILANIAPDKTTGNDTSNETLSGLFWNFTGNPTLTPVSATIAAGSLVQAATCDIGPCSAATTNVAGEFGYQAAAFPGGADRGISSSGYLTTGIPGNVGNFNNGAAGTDLDSPGSLDGINFGIVSANGTFSPNGGLANDPLIRDRVTFVLTGVSGLTVADISNVSFQYGTNLDEPNVPGNPGIPPTGTPIPEPGTVALLGLGLLALTMARRRQTRR